MDAAADKLAVTSLTDDGPDEESRKRAERAAAELARNLLTQRSGSAPSASMMGGALLQGTSVSGSPEVPERSSSRLVSGSRRGSAGLPAGPPPALHTAPSTTGPPKQVPEFTPLRDEPVLKSAQVDNVELFPVPPGQVGPQHFRKLKLLGKGGIGKVYLVLLVGTRKLFAMKVITKEEMIRKNKVKRVMTEREILATANHPFIVTMYASYQTATRLCLIMEFCEGGEFFRVLQRQPRKRLRESSVRFYAAEVLLALEYLHHMGFIYRDLKPENILMRLNGHIALTDFDLSKQAHAVSPRVIEHQLTAMEKMRSAFGHKRNGSKLNLLEIVDSEPVLAGEMTSFVGTEEYIAPEVISGASQSSAVDWWTLGILIFEMLTGATPFKGTNSETTFSNIINHQVRFPDDIEISVDCKMIVKKLLRREADRRLGSEQGATEIKRQRWFNNINFDLIRNETPPIVPQMRDPYDLSQYTEEDAADVRTWPTCIMES